MTASLTCYIFLTPDDQIPANVEGGYNSLNSMNIVKSVNCKQAVCSYISDGIFIIIYFYSHRSWFSAQVNRASPRKILSGIDDMWDCESFANNVRKKMPKGNSTKMPNAHSQISTNYIHVQDGSKQTWGWREDNSILGFGNHAKKFSYLWNNTFIIGYYVNKRCCFIDKDSGRVTWT